MPGSWTRIKASLFIIHEHFPAKDLTMHMEAVLFDLFNTLIMLQDDDAFYMPSLRKMHDHLVKSNIETTFEGFTEAYFKVRDGLYVETSVTLEEPHFDVRVTRTLQKLGYNYDASHPAIRTATEAFCAEFLKYMKPDDDALHVLKTLHGKYKLGIVSNLSIPECASKVLDKFDMTKYFEAIVISGAINRRKPSPMIFKMALDRLKVKPENAVFIGDTPGTDINGARNLGMKAILIDRPRTPQEASMSITYIVPETRGDTTPDAIIRSLREVLDILADC